MARPPADVREWAAIEPYFRTLPTLADAPERFEAALSELLFPFAHSCLPNLQ